MIATPTADDLVTVATYDVPVAAEVARNALAAEGIPAVVTDSDVAVTVGTLAAGGAKVLVPSGYAAQAALRIAAHDAAGGTEVIDLDELSRQALAAPPEDA